MKEETKEIISEAVESMQESISTCLWKAVGRSVMNVAVGDPTLRESLLMAGAMQMLASQANPDTEHGKLARRLALGMNLNVMDDLFVKGREVIMDIPLLQEHAEKEAELNAAFTGAEESLNEATKDDSKFCATKVSENTKSIPLPPANSVTPKNAVVISKPAVGDTVKSSTNPSRPLCAKCNKPFKTSRLRKVIFKSTDGLPEDLKKYQNKMLCSECHRVVMASARNIEQAAAQKAAQDKAKLEARDNLTKTNQSLAAEESKLANMEKALETVKTLSPDAASGVEAKIAEVKKCITALTEQRVRLEKVIAG